ncbi:MAG: hypothetical protein DRN59_03160 [Thaumarchaeota archaeon]|nr:MAG: hypothetical protein DRN59_03160 [Nitrososphaerota archaeon]
MDAVEEERLPSWLKLDKNLAKQLLELIKQEIRLKQAVVRGTLIMMVPRGDGVEYIRKAVAQGLKQAGRGERISITSIGPPKYLIRVEAEDQEKGRELIRRVAEACLSVIREAGGRGELQLK